MSLTSPLSFRAQRGTRTSYHEPTIYDSPVLPAAYEPTLDAFWAARLGCHSEDFCRRGVIIALRSAPTHPDVEVWLRNRACIVSLPPALRHVLDDVHHALAARDAASIFDREALVALFAGLGVSIELVLGPAFRSYTDASSFRPVDPRGTRVLRDRDHPLLGELRAACTPEEWDHSGLAALPAQLPGGLSGAASQARVYGCFAGAELAAAGRRLPVTSPDDVRIASHTDSAERASGVAPGSPAAGVAIDDLGVLTHPIFRGHGCATAVVSAMAADSLKAGRLPQYRTLESNHPSLAIARTLNFQPYARTLALHVRL